MAKTLRKMEDGTDDSYASQHEKWRRTMERNREENSPFNKEVARRDVEDAHYGAEGPYGTSIGSNSPLSKARSHLEKETERGDHSPKVGGHGTEQHGGRVPSNETSHSFANEPEDNLKGSKGSGYRD